MRQLKVNKNIDFSIQNLMKNVFYTVYKTQNNKFISRLLLNQVQLKLLTVIFN